MVVVKCFFSVFWVYARLFCYFSNDTMLGSMLFSGLARGNMQRFIRFAFRLIRGSSAVSFSDFSSAGIFSFLFSS